MLLITNRCKSRRSAGNLIARFAKIGLPVREYMMRVRCKFDVRLVGEKK